MAIKDRIARIEGNAKVSPQLNAATWWEQLLSKPKENEHRINAAFFLANDGLIQKPPARLWKQLEAATQYTAEELPDSLLAFCCFCSMGYRDNEEEEQELKELWADEENKEWLCLMATMFWDVFKTAPVTPLPENRRAGFSPERARIEARASLRRDFLSPLFLLIFPEENEWHYGRFEEWLEKDGLVESLLESAREHMQGSKA